MAPEALSGEIPGHVLRRGSWAEVDWIDKMTVQSLIENSVILRHGRLFIDLA
jgi:hypothetical protein